MLSGYPRPNPRRKDSRCRYKSEREPSSEVGAHEKCIIRGKSFHRAGASLYDAARGVCPTSVAIFPRKTFKRNLPNIFIKKKRKRTPLFRRSFNAFLSRLRFLAQNCCSTRDALKSERTFFFFFFSSLPSLFCQGIFHCRAFEINLAWPNESRRVSAVSR